MLSNKLTIMEFSNPCRKILSHLGFLRGLTFSTYYLYFRNISFYLFEFAAGASFPPELLDDDDEFRFFFFDFSELRERLRLFEGGLRDLNSCK